MSDDKKILELLSANRPPCIDTLNGKATQFISEPPSLKMEFEAAPEFCHSPNQVVQGGFVTGMLDTSMAHLLIALSGGKLNPVSLDINVSFLAPAHPGKLISTAKVVRLGKSIGYFSSSLYQQETLVATATSTIKLVPMP
jgi:uncharacterized protein (TIGR00369 family)